MPNEPSGEPVAPADGVSKKDFSNDQLKSYIQKARARIKKLESENKSLTERVEHAERGNTGVDVATSPGADAGLLTSLREEVDMWKTNYQEQANVNAEATAAAANGDGVHAEEQAKAAAELEALRQELEAAQGDAERWREKAMTAQDLQARLLWVEDELRDTKRSAELTERELRASYDKELAELQSAIHERDASVAKLRDEAEAARAASAELQAQADALLTSGGALEHRLASAQQDRDDAVAQASELEQQLQGLTGELAAAAAAAEAADASQVQARVEALERDLAQAAAGKAELRRALEQKESESSARGAEAARDRDEALAERDAAMVKAQTMEERLAALSDALEIAKAEGKEVVEAHATTVADLESERKRAINAKEEARARLAEAEETAKRELEAGCASAREESAGAQAAAERKAEALKERLIDLEGLVEELQTKSETASAAADSAREGPSRPHGDDEAAGTLDHADRTLARGGESSPREAVLLARCEELEAGTAAAGEKIALLESKLAAATPTGSEITVAGQGDGTAMEQAPGIKATENDDEGGYPTTEASRGGKEATADAAALRDEDHEAREHLERQLRAAEEAAAESTRSLQDLEGVIAALREQETSLETRLSALTEDKTTADEAASFARECLEVEKERAREIDERAETLARELEETKKSLATAAGAAAGAASETQEALGAEKEALEAQLQEARGKIAGLEDALAASASTSVEVAELAASKASLEARLSALDEDQKAAEEAASSAWENLNAEKERAQSNAERAEALARELEESRGTEAAAARAAAEASEMFEADKAKLEERLQEVAEEKTRLQEVQAASASSSMAAEEATAAASKAEEQCSALREQVAAQKEKLGKAIARIRALKAEKEATAEVIASRASVVEALQTELAGARGRCEALEEELREATAVAGALRSEAVERASREEATRFSLEQDLAMIRQELETATKDSTDARNKAGNAALLQRKLEEATARLEETRADFRLAEESAARLPAIEAELVAERESRAELLGQLEALRRNVEEMESAKDGVARDNEEIMVALHGQVDAANKERDAAAARVEAAEDERDSSKNKLREVYAKYKDAQTKLKAAQDEGAALKAEAERVPALEQKEADLAAKVEELEGRIKASDEALKEREDMASKTVSEKEAAALAEKSAREEVEGKVKRLKSLLAKLQKSSHSKDAEIAVLKAPPPPKAFAVELRVRHQGSTWCLIRPAPATEATGGNSSATTAEGVLGGAEAKTQWVVEDKARAWMGAGSSSSEDALWPAVLQDSFEERAASAAQEARVAEEGAASTRADIERLASEFTKYKARAHTALKKATASGAEDKRKDEQIVELERHRDQLVAELGDTRKALEKELADVRSVSRAREDDLESASTQLETAQEEVREVRASLVEKERRVTQLQEAEDGHGEEVADLRQTIEDLKAQLKACKAQVQESSSIAQRLQEELENRAHQRGTEAVANGGGWSKHLDGGWAGQQLLDSRRGAQATGGLSDVVGPSEDSTPDDPAAADRTSVAASVGVLDGTLANARVGEAVLPGQDVKLVAVAELERRQSTMHTQKEADVSELRSELAEALLRVEQLSEQESVLKDTVRALETELKAERDLATGEAATVNVAYLKSAVVRYMSTRDAGEQRSLLRVISTILQLTRQEIEGIEARITELERTMVRRAGSMVGGAGRRVGGVVGGVVGLVWRGGGGQGLGRPVEDEDFYQDTESDRVDD